MRLRVANAPASWGIEDPEDPRNPSWLRVLDETAATGYAGIELGPLGFLPTGDGTLRAELATRRIELVAGYVMEPLHAAAEAERAVAIARATCEVLAACGGHLLVVIQGFTPERDRGAGRPGAAPGATRDEWSRLVDTVHRIATIASDRDLLPCFHPHAGTHVEFEDEVERIAADTDPALVRLCLDTGHSAYAGIDPVALYRRHAERVAHLHLKDVDRGRLDAALARGRSFDEAVGDGVFCPLGEGVVDFPALRDALCDGRYDGWGTVEQDRLPADSTTPAEDAAASIAHLRAVGLATEAARVTGA